MTLQPKNIMVRFKGENNPTNVEIQILEFKCKMFLLDVTIGT